MALAFVMGKDMAMDGLGLVVAAGGSSTRFGGGNKLFELLGGEPVFIRCLRNLMPCVHEHCCVLVVPQGEMGKYQFFLDDAGIAGVTLAAGGSNRGESVCNGLAALPENLPVAAVQDAARPFTEASLLLECADSAFKYGSGVAAHRLVDTIKVAGNDGIAIDTLDRSTLWAAETPQAFCKLWLEQAYRHCLGKNIAVTDDAQAVHAIGHKAHLVENKAVNLKITNRSDLVLARALLMARERE